MGRGRRIALAAGAVVVVAVGGAAVYLGPIAPIATGYAAKLSCSGVFVAERSLEEVTADLPDNPLVPFLRVSNQEEPAAVRASLLGLWPSTAHHGQGTGCTLAEQPSELARLAAPTHPDPTAPWPTGDGPLPELPADIDAAALGTAIDLAFTEDDPDGRARNTRAVVVARDGELVVERDGDGFDADTPLLGWSMAKSVASALAGVAVHAEELNLDDEVVRPGWEADDRATMTVEHLLTMTDGLAFDEVYDPDTDATQMLFTPGDAGGFAAAKPLEHPPGTHWSYSSGTTNILCDGLQEAGATGVGLAHERIFTPLGMTSAVLEADASGGLVCSSFLYATARDWARFGQLYLDDGVWEGERLLPEGWVDTSFSPVEQAIDTP